MVRMEPSGLCAGTAALRARQPLGVRVVCWGAVSSLDKIEASHRNSVRRLHTGLSHPVRSAVRGWPYAALQIARGGGVWVCSQQCHAHSNLRDGCGALQVRGGEEEGGFQCTSLHHPHTYEAASPRLGTPMEMIRSGAAKLDLFLIGTISASRRNGQTGRPAAVMSQHEVRALKGGVCGRDGEGQWPELSQIVDLRRRVVKHLAAINAGGAMKRCEPLCLSDLPERHLRAAGVFPWNSVRRVGRDLANSAKQPRTVNPSVNRP